MKQVIFSLLMVLLMISCGDEKRQNFTTLNDDGEIVMTDESLGILEDIIADYYDCKEDETDEHECNQFTSEAICRFYGIDDFKEDDHYVSYRDIREIVTLRGNWEPIGMANNQADLDRAQEHANNAKATIAFDPNATNHVAIILPGQQQLSNSWGLEAPNSASFFVHKPEAYVNKALSYSFRSPEGIILYSKK